MRLLLASSNSHKIAEVRAILQPHGIEVIGLDALDDQPAEPVEDGRTFQDNARIKAVHYAHATGRMCLADDSGLAVDALGGDPGVRSARYADGEGTRAERDEANNAKLLAKLKGVPTDKRTARFVCAMCLADADGTILAESHGTLEGVIGEAAQGSNGFGYDPLMYLPVAGCTSAQLTPDQKNACSHRGAAARQMAEQIARLKSGKKSDPTQTARP